MKKKTETDLAGVARVVHEAVRAWQVSNEQDAAPPWSKAPKWMKESTLAAVRFRLDNPRAPASIQHEQWMIEKHAGGWKFGKTKDGVKKTHPLLIPYNQLPLVERRKDALVAGVIDALVHPMP
jgi:hypothetical protein